MSDPRLQALKDEVLAGRGWVKQHDGSYVRGGKRRPEAKALPVVDGKRVRQSQNKLNQLELEWQALLQRDPNVRCLRAHAITFLLGNGVRYTPDFTAFVVKFDGVPQPTAWEVKGKHAWDDAKVKAKMAPTEFPEWRWLMVWKEAGQWRRQELLPK